MAHSMLHEQYKHKIDPDALPPMPMNPQREREIALRWKLWEPWAIIQASKSLDPAQALYSLKELHRSRQMLCVRLNIAPRIVKRMELDDPRRSTMEFCTLIAEAEKRHSERLGREKGKGKRPGRKINSKKSKENHNGHRT